MEITVYESQPRDRTESGLANAFTLVPPDPGRFSLLITYRLNIPDGARFDGEDPGAEAIWEGSDLRTPLFIIVDRAKENDEGYSLISAVPARGPEGREESADLRWRGIEVSVREEPGEPDTYYVEFDPIQPMSARGPDGEFRRVPSPARVIVKGREDLRVFAFRGPGLPMPHLSREDYEERALDEVRVRIARN